MNPATEASATSQNRARRGPVARAWRALKDLARDLGLALLTVVFGIVTLITPRRTYRTTVRMALAVTRLFGRDHRRALTIEQTFCRGYGLFRRGWPADVEVRGLENVRSAHAEERGVVVWVMGFLDQTALNLALADAGYPVSFLSSENHGVYSPRWISRRLAAPIINRAVTRSLQRLVVIPLDGNRRYVKELCRVLETEHGTVGMKGDVTDTLGAVEAPYRGGSAAFPTGAVSLALLTGAPLVTGSVLRHDVLRHEVVIDEPIPVPRDVSRNEAIRLVVQEYARRLDARATAHPTSRPRSRFDKIR